MKYINFSGAWGGMGRGTIAFNLVAEIPGRQGGWMPAGSIAGAPYLDIEVKYSSCGTPFLFSSPAPVWTPISSIAQTNIFVAPF